MYFYNAQIQNKTLLASHKLFDIRERLFSFRLACAFNCFKKCISKTKSSLSLGTQAHLWSLMELTLPLRHVERMKTFFCFEDLRQASKTSSWALCRTLQGLLGINHWGPHNHILTPRPLILQPSTRLYLHLRGPRTQHDHVTAKLCLAQRANKLQIPHCRSLKPSDLR